MVNPVEGEDKDGQHDTFGRPSWVSHLPAGPTKGYKVSIKAGYFYIIILWLGKMKKPVFLFPAMHWQFD